MRALRPRLGDAIRSMHGLHRQAYQALRARSCEMAPLWTNSKARAMSEWTCPQCRAVNLVTGVFCEFCGIARAASRRSEPTPEASFPDAVYFAREQNLRAWDVLRGVLDGEISEDQASRVIDAIEHQG